MHQPRVYLSAEVCLLNILALHKLLACARKNYLSGFKNISSVGDRKTLTCVLLNKKDCCSVIIYILNDFKNLIDKQRRKTH